MNGVSPGRAARVELLLRLDDIPDPGDMLTWTVGGEPLTVDQLRVLAGLTRQDAEDATALLRLDLELNR